VFADKEKILLARQGEGRHKERLAGLCSENPPPLAVVMAASWRELLTRGVASAALFLGGTGVFSLLIPAGSSRGGDIGPGGVTCNSIVGEWFGENIVNANNPTAIEEQYCASEADSAAAVSVISESRFVVVGIAALVARAVYRRNGNPDDRESDTGLVAGTF
jgi:hypothetical protein